MPKEKCLICGSIVPDLPFHTSRAHQVVAPVLEPPKQEQTPRGYLYAPGAGTKFPKGMEFKEEASNGHHVFSPQADSYFLVTEDVAAELEIADKLSLKHPINLLVTGQPGGGKTSLGLQFASKYSRPCVVVDFGALQEPQELFHTTQLKSEGNSSVTDIRESGFVKGLETPRCVVVLDELNRPENERVLNPLLPFLDGRRSSYIDYLRRIVRVADGVVFIATLNEGAMFCGVSSIDVALRDRFRELHMAYLTPEQEVEVIQRKTGVPIDIARILADFAGRVRRAGAVSMKVSTRQLLTAAENYGAGDELWRAVSTSIGHFNDTGWREQVMEVLHLAMTSIEEVNKWSDSKSRGTSYVQL